MPRALRIGLWCVVALVVLVVAGAGVFALTFDPNSYKPQIVAAVQKATGRDFTIDGRIRLGLSLQPTLTIQNASIANPAGFSRPRMATLQELDLKLALWPLLSHTVEIYRLELVKPDILLEINRQGWTNWQFTPRTNTTGTPGPSGTSDGKSTRIDVRALDVTDGTVTWRDDTTMQQAVLAVQSLTVRAPSPDSNVNLAMTASFNGNPFSMEGEVGSLAALQGTAAKAPMPVRMTLQAAGAKIAVDGSISQPEQMRGYTLKLDANVPNLAALGRFVPEMALPPLHDVTLAMQLADSGKALPAISNMALHVGASDLSGTIGGLKIDKLDVTAPKPDAPVQVAGQGSFGQAPASLNGSLGIPPSLLSGGKLSGSVPIDLTLVALGSNVTVKGNAGQTKDGRPMVQGDIRSPQIDADALMAALHSKPAVQPASAGAAPAPAVPRPAARPANGRMVPDTPLPFDLLRMADANVKLDVASLKFGGTAYKAITGTLALNGGKLRIDPLSASLPEGKLSGAVTADANAPAPPVTLKLNAPALALGPLLQAIGEPVYLSGNMEVHADLSGAGATPQAIVSGLNGTLGVAIANGTVDNRLLGSTLGSLLRGVNALDLVGRGGTSQLQCFAARLDARSGTATVRTLVLSSSLLTMDGTGTLNLGPETLDLRLRPEGRVAGTAVVVPVRVTGPMRAPNAEPDAAAAVAANAGTVAGTVLGTATPLGAVAGLLGGQKLLGGQEGVNCGAAIAMARGEAAPAAAAPAAAPAQSAPPGQPAQQQQKLPNPGNLLKKLIP